jgi:hypothetical protein
MSNYSSTLDNKISSQIQSQFPEFVQSEHSTFVQFLKLYYQFLESAELTLLGSNDYIIEETQTVNYILYSDNTKIVDESSVGKFTVGEIIVGQNSKATAKVLVDDFDNNNKLFITSQQLFDIGEVVVGQTSGSYATIDNYRGNPVQNIQQFLEYADLDYTLYSFLDRFRDAFMETIPSSLANNLSKRNLLKNIKELYNSKGTEDGHKLFFRILLNEESEIIYPRDNILRASDGVWSTDKIMRVVENGVSDFNNLIGKRIYTKDSTNTILSSAIVATVVKFREGATLVAELNLDRDSISGVFNSGDTIYGIDNVLDLEISGIVKSIVTNASLENSGFYYNAGDSVDIQILGSETATARVDTVGSGNINEIMVDNGGSGYVLTDQLIFNNTETEGIGASAKIAVVGGSFLLEDYSSPDHLITEEEDYIIFEDNFYLQFERSNSDNGFLELENGDTIIVEEETFVDLSLASEIGEIRKIKIINEGSGYIKLPTITVSSSTGSNASLYAVSNKFPGVGHAQGVSITNFGLDYNTVPKFTLNRNVILKSISGNFSAGDRLSSHNATVVDYNSSINLLKLNTESLFTEGDIIIAETGSTAVVHFSSPAIATAQIGTIGTTVGNFLNERGKLSNDVMKLQDSFYYQDYSYVVRIGQSINEWRESLKQSIHPSGWNIFGEVSISTLLSTQVGVPTYGLGTQEIALSPTVFENLFTSVFGRRLGLASDTSLASNSNTGYDLSSELINGERDVTLNKEIVVSLSVSRGSRNKGSVLANLPKYAFAVPPFTTNDVVSNYPNPAGRIATIPSNITRDLYPIQQFGHYTIKSVSDYSFLRLEEGLDGDGDKILLEDNGYLQDEILTIPDTAYATRINVPPPSEILKSQIGSITFDKTTVSFDNTNYTFDSTI